MAEQRKAATRGNIVKNPRAEAKTTETNVEEMIKGIEDQAGDILKKVGNWVNQGEELIGKSRAWLKEHPVATAFAVQYAKKMKFVPGNIEEARSQARQAGDRISSTAKEGIAAIRENPMDALLIGAGLGLAAAVVIKNR